MSSRDAWHQVAATGTWFAGLPSTFSDALLALAESVSLATGQRLFARGDAPDGLYCVLRGVVRVTAISASGQEAILAMLEPPQWFGEIAVFDGQPRTHDCTADEDARVWFVPQRALDELLAAQPHFLGPLLFHTYVGYYQQPRALAALGLEPRPPHPKGHALETGDFGLLEAVRARGKIYRDA